MTKSIKSHITTPAQIPKNQDKSTRFASFLSRGGHGRQLKVNSIAYRYFGPLRPLQSPPFLKGDLGGFSLCKSKIPPVPPL
jgi:hypothetical protein